MQRDVPEAVRTSAFARSETLLQLSWVVGGAIGIVLPLDGQLGLGIAAAGLLGMLVCDGAVDRAAPSGEGTAADGTSTARPDTATRARC